MCQSRDLGIFPGTWTFPVTEEYADAGLIHFTGDGRAIQFVFLTSRPEKRVAMRLWYSIESETELRFRTRPDEPGWLRQYRGHDDVFLIAEGERTWSCKKASADDLPSWFPQALDAALKMMIVESD